MVLNYGYGQKQSQSILMTSKRKMSLDILQLNRYRLDHYLLDEWMRNPMLENSTDLQRDDDNVVFLKDGLNSFEPIQVPSEDIWENIPYKPDLKQFLKSQLSEFSLSYKERNTAEFIIDSLDGEGYFREKSSYLLKCLSISEAEMKKILSVVQGLEPAGIAATDLKDCLLIQAKAKGFSNRTLQIIDHFLLEVSRNELSSVSKKLKCPISVVQQCFDKIRSLNPIPANGYLSLNEPIQYCLPDVKVECTVNGLNIYHFSGVEYPLQINRPYYQMMCRKSDVEVYRFLHEHYLSAQMLLRSIEQRTETLQKVVHAIIYRQRDFFRHGFLFLMPMSLKDIAMDVGMSESTISRAICGKIIETPYGVFEWKKLFTKALEADHSIVSTNHIRNMIAGIVSKEDTKAPLNDREISEILTQMGFPIARRTVQKYREELGIFSARLRRRYE